MIAVNIRSAVKWLAIITAVSLALVIAIACIKLSYFYYSEVRPYRAKINHILAQAAPAHHDLPQQMHALIEADFYCFDDQKTKHFIGKLGCGLPKEAYMAKLLINTHHPTEHEGVIDRTLRQLMVTHLIVQPLSNQDEDTLLSELTYFDKDIQGFSQFSRAYFNRPLDQLSLQELATIIAFTHAPSKYKQDLDALKRRQQYLLSQYSSYKRSL